LITAFWLYVMFGTTPLVGYAMVTLPLNVLFRVAEPTNAPLGIPDPAKAGPV
jgi:hypothetical protein